MQPIPRPETIAALQQLTRQFLSVATHSVEHSAELSLPQMRLLFAVADHQGASCSELARDLSVAASSVTRLADRLVERGYLRRTHGERGRVVVELELTDAGTEALDEVTSWRTEFFIPIATALSEFPGANAALDLLSGALGTALRDGAAA